MACGAHVGRYRPSLVKIAFKPGLEERKTGLPPVSWTRRQCRDQGTGTRQSRDRCLAPRSRSRRRTWRPNDPAAPPRSQCSFAEETSAPGGVVRPGSARKPDLKSAQSTTTAALRLVASGPWAAVGGVMTPVELLKRSKTTRRPIRSSPPKRNAGQTGWIANSIDDTADRLQCVRAAFVKPDRDVKETACGLGTAIAVAAPELCARPTETFATGAETAGAVFGQVHGATGSVPFERVSQCGRVAVCL